MGTFLCLFYLNKPLKMFRIRGSISRDSSLVGLGCNHALKFLKSSPGGSNMHPRTTVLELGNPLDYLFLGAESAAASPERLKQDVFCGTLVAPEEVNRCYMEKGFRGEINSF